MKLNEELKHWGYHSSISDEGKKQHLEMAESAERLEEVARLARYFINGNWDFKEGSDSYDRHEMLIDALDAFEARSELRISTL